MAASLILGFFACRFERVWGQGLEFAGQEPEKLSPPGDPFPTETANRLFLRSFHFQTVTNDLAAAFQGFNDLTRSRRGEPWLLHEGRCVGRDGNGPIKSGGRIERAGDRGTERDGCWSSFLRERAASIEAFVARSGDEFKFMTSEQYKTPAAWGADTLSASTRGNMFLTAIHKLDHDKEQLEYLTKKGRLPPESEDLLLDYIHVRDMIISEIQGHTATEPVRGAFYMMRPHMFERLHGVYNSLVYVPPPPGSLPGGETKSSLGRPWHPTGFQRALNPSLDWGAIEKSYLKQDLPLLWFDGFLTSEALEGVLDFCREATVFFDVRAGYLGAYMNEGLTSPWLLQIATELGEMLPKVLEGMVLTNMWAYKYDSDTSMEGITVHADNAAVNLNFWICPDEANLDPETGGLVVYPTEPPNGGAVASIHSSRGTERKGQVDSIWNDWSKKAYIKSWLREEGHLYSAVNIPHKQNRAVLFDSRLLHETAPFRFKPGYANRRINLTFLFSPATEGSLSSP